MHSKELIFPFVASHPYTLISIVGSLVYANCIYCGFVFDDLSAVKTNRDVLGSSSFPTLFSDDFWGTPLASEHSHKSYRPLTVLFYRLVHALFGLDTRVFHTANLILHVLVTCSLYRVYRDVIGCASSTAVLAAMLFVVHPIHCEAVTSVVGCAELLMTLFFLAAVLVWVRDGTRSFIWNALLAGVFSIVSAFCKEQGATVVLFLGVIELSQRRSVRHFVVLFCVGVLIFTLRVLALAGSLPVFTEADNPAAAQPFPIRHFTFNYLLALNAWLLLCPQWLCADWTMGTVPLVRSALDLRNAGTLLFYFTLLALCMVRHRRLFFAMCLLVFPFLPASNLLVYVGFVVAERVLYLPSAGFCLLIAEGFSSLRCRRLVFFLTLVVLGARTHLRNNDWRDDLSLFRSALRVSQRNAKVFNNIGHALEMAPTDRLGEALVNFERATQVEADDVGAWINVGRVLVKLERFAEAEQAFLRAKNAILRPGVVRISPSYLNAFLNLGNLYRRNTSRVAEAEAAFAEALSLRADFIPAYLNLGDSLLQRGRTTEAIDVFQRGLEQETGNADLLYNIGIALLKSGRKVEALERFEAALRSTPGHYRSLVNSALLLAEDPPSKREARARLARAIKQGESDEKFDGDDLRTQLASIDFDLGELHEAAAGFASVLARNGTNRAALMNLAVVELELGEVDSAFARFRLLIERYPTYVRGLLTFADALVARNVARKEAKRLFERVLALESTNVQARHNLCIVLIDADDVDEADKCIEAARRLVGVVSGYTSAHVDVLLRRVEARRGQHP